MEYHTDFNMAVMRRYMTQAWVLCTCIGLLVAQCPSGTPVTPETPVTAESISMCANMERSANSFIMRSEPGCTCQIVISSQTKLRAVLKSGECRSSQDVLITDESIAQDNRNRYTLLCETGNCAEYTSTVGSTYLINSLPSRDPDTLQFEVILDALNSADVEPTTFTIKCGMGTPTLIGFSPTSPHQQGSNKPAGITPAFVPTTWQGTTKLAGTTLTPVNGSTNIPPTNQPPTHTPAPGPGSGSGGSGSGSGGSGSGSGGSGSGSGGTEYWKKVVKNKYFIIGVVLSVNLLLIIMISTAIISCRSFNAKMARLRHGSKRRILSAPEGEGSIDGLDSRNYSDMHGPTGRSDYGSVFHVDETGSNDFQFTY